MLGVEVRITGFFTFFKHNCFKCVAAYQQKIKNVYVFRNQRNQGLCYSRNRVLKESQGEIIVFVDDDVSLFPDCLDQIVKVYTESPQILFIWGGVYQCHGDYDRNELTFGSGSLFSMRRIVANYFQFDTNIRYFKTYVCEEHDFARRLKKTQVKMMQLNTAKANHYQAPAKNRPWRGLGGDLNYLYEKVKNGSILEYYKSLFIGFQYAMQRLIKKHNFKDNLNFNSYIEAVYSFYNVLLLIKDKKIWIAQKYLFYVIIDIPIRALIKRRIETKQTYAFKQAIQEILK